MHSLLYLVLLSGLWRASAPEAPVQGLGGGRAGSGGGAVAVAPAPAVASLRADLDRLVQAPGWPGDRWGVLVVSLDRGDTLYAREPDVGLVPASNLKLFTSAAALYYLGPEFRYTTYLLAAGRVEDGVLRGDLVLYGTGDPTISERFHGSRLAVWRAFADTLAALGVREVQGDVVGDASYFEGLARGRGWETSYMNAAYAASASALSFGENVALLQIRPGPSPGSRPSVRVVPGGDGAVVVNEATTVRGGGTSIRALRVSYEGPIVVRGQIGVQSGGVLRSVPVPDPALYAAAAFREVLEEAGIRVAGTARSVLRASESPVTGRSVFAPALERRAPLQVLAVHHSPPLREIVEVTNKKSHNLMAEQLLRTVGRVTLGEGTVEAGFRAVRYLLECETGVDGSELYMDDGSGLSPLNRATPHAVVGLLSYMAASPLWEPYWESLPEAGARDGLRRMYKTAAERNLRAKTGTINRVSALSGYVRAANGERLAFSIISNAVPSTWRAKRVEDAIGARLAAFQRPVSEGAATMAQAPPGGAAAQPAVPDTTAAPDTTATPAVGGVAGVHVVRPGETLSGIAQRYGTTVEALLAANPGIEPRRIRPGQEIRLPTGATTVSATAGAADDGVGAAGARTHTIRRGDTFEAIARQYGTTVAELMQANPGLDPRRLIPGKKIRLP
jgi:D-alanyl-D-alanine carboxypeptidase/D-alanyl-D-alanine-endopeptidase (penicillin-binding protein 4)